MSLGMQQDNVIKSGNYFFISNSTSNTHSLSPLLWRGLAHVRLPPLVEVVDGLAVGEVAGVEGWADATVLVHPMREGKKVIFVYVYIVLPVIEPHFNRVFTWNLPLQRWFMFRCSTPLPVVLFIETVTTASQLFQEVLTSCIKLSRQTFIFNFSSTLRCCSAQSTRNRRGKRTYLQESVSYEGQGSEKEW